MVYTSRYSNPELRSGNYTAVRISVGAPRWKVGYEIAGVIQDLMPQGLRNIEELEKFSQLYCAKLDRVGVDRIREQIQYYEVFGKSVVLLCFEDIRKGGDNWCHRNIFAKWWENRTGEAISELKDDSTFKVEGEKIILPDVPPKVTSSEDVGTLTNENPRILVQYSIWKPYKEYGEYLGGDVYYQIDKDTGKLTRIPDKDARELISSGRANAVMDYASVEKLKFVLMKDSTVRVYRVNKHSQEKEIDLTDAVYLAANGMATVQDIQVEK